MATAFLGRHQLARLLQLIVAMRGGRFPNARQLSEICEVSRRTIYRDLETLALAGVPVEYRQERQGYRIVPGFAFDPPKIEEKEAIALSVLVEAWSAGDDLGLLADARAALLKVIDSLVPEEKSRVGALAAAVGRSGAGAPPQDREGLLCQTILHALGQRRQLRLWYREPPSESPLATRFAPYRLWFQSGHWHLLGRSSIHRDIRTLTLADIDDASLSEDAFEIPLRLEPERYADPPPDQAEPPPLAQFVLAFDFDPSDLPKPPDGTIEVRSRDGRFLDFTVRDLKSPALVPWILSLGDRVEVVEPPELRNSVQELALQIATRNGAIQPSRLGGRG